MTRRPAGYEPPKAPPPPIAPRDPVIILVVIGLALAYFLLSTH